MNYYFNNNMEQIYGSEARQLTNSQYDCEINEFEGVERETIIANAAAAGLFFIGFCFALFVMFKYLIFMNKCEQKTMIIFYTIVLADLGTRVTYLIYSCFVSQKNHTLLMSAALSTIASVLAGVSHSQNLSRLLFDLSSVECETREQYEKLYKKRYIFHGLLVAWLILTSVYFYFILAQWYEMSTIGETILFSLLGIQLLIINIKLLRIMKRIFGEHIMEKNFKHELKFLISTLILFSISYLVSVLRNLFIFWMLENEVDDEEEKIHKIWCSTNFDISVFNIICYIITELIPYIVIFVLNFNNFKQMNRQKEFTESRKRERL